MAYTVHYVFFLVCLLIIYCILDLWKALEADILKIIGFRPVADLKCQPVLVTWFKSFVVMCSVFAVVTFYLSRNASSNY